MFAELVGAAEGAGGGDVDKRDRTPSPLSVMLLATVGIPHRQKPHENHILYIQYGVPAISPTH